jgi:hypothetical protein
MTKIILISIILIAATVFAWNSCTSEKGKASIEVMKNKMEDKLVDLAGKGQVALQMHRNRHAKIKSGLIRIKASQVGTKRKLDDKKTQLNTVDSADAKASISTLIATYEAHIIKLETSEQKAIAALQSSVEGYEKLKLKVSLLEEQIDLAKTMTSVETSINFDDTSASVDSLIKEMERDLDLAEATLAVEQLNLDIN